MTCYVNQPDRPPSSLLSRSDRALTSRGSAQVRGVAVVARPVARARRASVTTSAALSVHTVKSGDNLWAIARARGTTVDELRAVNASSIGRGDVIYPGQQLIIPATAKRSALGVPSGYRPSTPSYGNYSTATSSSRASTPAFSRAKLAETQGLGLVTAGAFFIALAAGIWLFKDDKYKDGAAARGGFDERRDGYVDGEEYDQAQGRDGWVDRDGNYASNQPQQPGGYEQYNQGDWQAYQGSWNSQPNRSMQQPSNGNPNIW